MFFDHCVMDDLRQSLSYEHGPYLLTYPNQYRPNHPPLSTPPPPSPSCSVHDMFFDHCVMDDLRLQLVVCSSLSQQSHQWAVGGWQSIVATWHDPPHLPLPGTHHPWICLLHLPIDVCDHYCRINLRFFCWSYEIYPHDNFHLHLAFGGVLSYGTFQLALPRFFEEHWCIGLCRG